MPLDVLTGSRTELPQVDRCRMLWEDAKEYFGGYHQDISEELDFCLKLRQWEDDPGQTRDRRRIQPKGIELYNLIRHKVGQIMKSPLFIEARPVDDRTDELMAEVAKFAVEHVIYDPGLRFPAHMERLVVGALAGRMWGIEWFHDPNNGPFGNIGLETFDIRRFVWTPGHFDCMESRCPWTIKHVPMTLEQVDSMRASGWNIGDLKADGMLDSDTQRHNPYDSALWETGRAGPRTTRTPIVHVLFCRFKRDTRDRKKVVRDPFKKLPDEARYMLCPNCGIKTTEHPRRRDGSLPPTGMACPNCKVAVLERVDHERIEDDILTYPEGRLSIIAPFQNHVFYDDVWPQKLRGFPQATYAAYVHPAEPIGMSDTSLHWDTQLVSNSMLRMGYEQMCESKGIFISDEDGLVDAHGDPFTGSDENGRWAFRPPDTMGRLEFFQPQGLNQAWVPFVQVIQGIFKSTLGTSDLGLTPTASKDIPVGTVRALVESGNIPVDHHTGTLRQTQTYMLNNIYDMIRETWTEARYIRVIGPAGEQAMKLMRGSDMPSADLRLYADPSLRQVKIDEAQVFQQVAMMPPHIRRFVAKQLAVSPLALRQLEQEEQAMAEKAATQGIKPPNRLNGRTGGPLGPDGPPGATVGMNGGGPNGLAA